MPETLALASLSAGPIGTITLTPDPLESRIDSVMALMTLNDKIGQMIQGLVPTTSSGGFNWGSALGWWRVLFFFFFFCLG